MIELLELFDKEQRPLSLTEVATELGCPPSSTLALLKSLHALGYLSHDLELRRYSPTMRVAMLGGWIQGRMFRGGTIIALMNEVQQHTGETVILGLQNGLQVQYVHTVQSQTLLRNYLRPGTLRPIFRSAVGQVLLSRQTPERVRRLVEQANAEVAGGTTLVNLAQLQDTLAQVRTDGFAYSDRITRGACAIAILLPPQAGQQPMALCVAGSRQKLHPVREATARTMQELAARHLRSRARSSCV
ncbi:MAG TPA: IclR family transcriptional regulator C-terminal domain-containing protein [Burkholderiaceae bacterium]